MASRNSSRAAYAPSAPPVPDPNDEPQLAHPYHHRPDPTPPPATYSHPPPNYNYSQTPPATTTGSGYEYGYGYGSGQSAYGYYPQQQPQRPPATSMFPPGTDPEVIRSYQLVDRDQNGFIDEKELQQALTSAYQKFSLRTIRLLIFLFRTNSIHSSFTIGPKEFAAVWSCLGQWRAIFERFDRDRSGKIDSTELRDAFYGIGYAVPPSVLQVLISRYDDGSGRRVELGFDYFVECGMIVKGLTEKFKEKDPRYTGSATLKYEEFLSMIIPFLATD